MILSGSGMWSNFASIIRSRSQHFNASAVFSGLHLHAPPALQYRRTLFLMRDRPIIDGPRHESILLLCAELSHCLPGTAVDVGLNMDRAASQKYCKHAQVSVRLLLPCCQCRAATAATYIIFTCSLCTKLAWEPGDFEWLTSDLSPAKRWSLNISSRKKIKATQTAGAEDGKR